MLGVIVRPGGMMAFSTAFGLWAGTPGNFHRVASAGQTIEVAPGDVRKVSKVSWLSDDSSGPGSAQSLDLRLDRLTGLPFNDSGQVVLHLTFEPAREAGYKTEGILIATLPARMTATPTAQEETRIGPLSNTASPAGTAESALGAPAQPVADTVGAAADPASSPASALLDRRPPSKLPSPWRPGEKRAWGRPVLVKETPLDVSKLAWPSAETKLVPTRWLPVSSNPWASGNESICFSDDLRHVAYIAQKGIGRMVLVKDGVEGQGFDRIREPVRLSADFGFMAYKAERSGKEFLVHVTPQGQREYEYLNGEPPTYLPKHERIQASDDARHVFSLIAVAHPDHAGRSRPRSLTFVEMDGIRQTSPIACDPREVMFTKNHVVQRGAKRETIVDGKVVAGGQTGVDGKSWSTDGKRRLDVVSKPGKTAIEVWLDDQVLAVHENAASVPSEFVVFSPNQGHVAYVVRSKSQAAVMLDGKLYASYPPTATVKGLCFSPDSVGLAYSVKTGDHPSRIVAVVNGHEGPMEEDASDLRIFYGSTSQEVAYLLGAGDRAQAKLVVNGASTPAQEEGITALRFTQDAKHVIGMGRKSVMADGTALGIVADRLWNLEVNGSDRFSAFVHRGGTDAGISTQFLKLEFQVVPQSMETTK